METTGMGERKIEGQEREKERETVMRERKIERDRSGRER